MLLHSIELKNMLSFGPDAPSLQMRQLNVLIGANGSGKSNVIEAIGLLRAAPRDIAAPIREGGGIGDWIWRGEPQADSATIEVVVDNPGGSLPLRCRLGFAECGQRFQLTEEQIENAEVYPGHGRPYIFFERKNSRALLNYRDGTQRQLRPEEIDSEQSILSQRKDPDHYPELTYLGNALDRIRLYREWTIGRYTAPRLPQKADLPNDFLSADARNLGLVLNSLRRQPKVKARIIKSLQKLYEGVTDFELLIEGGTAQIFLEEAGITVPATRLSDGTLRYLCLLAILCHPNPPPLVCLEEPELGLHPDIIPTIADLLIDASNGCQLVVTTHSPILVDALTRNPECVIVCEKHDGQTSMSRLDQKNLVAWLKDYELGELWSKGELGGTRW